MNQQAKPDVQRLRLRRTLRKAREDAGLTQRGVADELDWSLSKLIRIESGQVSVSRTDLKAMLDLYHVSDPDLVEQLIQLGREGRKQGWASFRDIHKPEYLQFLGYESAASISRHFEHVVIPGLLQTRDYAAAMAREFTLPGTSQETIERLLEARARRQELLENEQAQLHFIVDEAVIRRWVGTGPGDPSIMRSQLEQLKMLGRRPHIDIQVVPFRHGLHAGMRGPFVLLQLDGVDDMLLYLEAEKGSSITRDNSEMIRRYEQIFVDLSRVASRPDELDSVLDPILKEMQAAS